MNTMNYSIHSATLIKEFALYIKDLLLLFVLYVIKHQLDYMLPL